MHDSRFLFSYSGIKTLDFVCCILVRLKTFKLFHAVLKHLQGWCTTCCVVWDGSFLFLHLHLRELSGCLMQRIAYVNFCHRVCHCSCSLTYKAMDVYISCMVEMPLPELCPDVGLKCAGCWTEQVDLCNDPMERNWFDLIFGVQLII